MSAEGLSNVDVVQGAPDDPKLPSGSIDAALIVNAYHEMTEHQAMLAKIKAALKPSGRLVIVEPISRDRRDARREDQTRNHEIAAQLVLADARAAGFSQVALHDPFTERPNGHDEEWMLVLTPAAPAPAPSASAQRAAPVYSARSEDWKAPALRISVAEFKRLPAGDVLVLDVRDAESYRQGHLPDAVLMTPEELATPEGVAKLKGERRQIVAYCS
jgi:SAM-dependent methyltransferase